MISSSPLPDIGEPRAEQETKPGPYSPPDVLQAYDEWGANCGPGAIAAIVGLSLADLRPHLQAIDWPGYTNPTHVKKVLAALSVYCENRPRWDIKGLAHVQFEGDWEKAGPRAAYRYSHWIAYRWSSMGYLAYDVNYGEQGEGGWCRYAFWTEHIAPQLYPKRCTGHRVRQFIEVLG